MIGNYTFDKPSETIVKKILKLAKIVGQIKKTPPGLQCCLSTFSCVFSIYFKFIFFPYFSLFSSLCQIVSK